MIGLLYSEWVKARSVRSTWIIVALALASIGLFAMVAWNAAQLWDSFTPEQRSTMSVAPLAPVSAWVASLCLAVLGVLAITGEYQYGSIQYSFVVAPKRGLVLFAKAWVLTMIAAVVGFAATLGTSLAARSIFDGRPVAGQTAPWSSELPLLISCGSSVVMFALFGLGLGAVLRSATASIAIIVVLWHPLPMIAMALPAPWNEWIGSALPGALAGQLSGEGNQHLGSMLSPPEALIVMALYAFAPLLLGSLLTARRDVR